MVWPVVTAARPPGGRGREDVPLAPQNRVAEGVSRPRRQGRGPRTATRVRLSHCPQSEDHGVFPKVTLWEGCDHAHANNLPFRSVLAVRPNRRPSPRGARFTGHAKVRLWSRRRGSVAPRRVTCRCRGLTNPPSPPTPSSVSLDFDSCPGQPPPAKSVAAPP